MQENEQFPYPDTHKLEKMKVEEPRTIAGKYNISHKYNGPDSLKNQQRYI